MKREGRGGRGENREGKEKEKGEGCVPLCVGVRRGGEKRNRGERGIGRGGE